MDMRYSLAIAGAVPDPQPVTREMSDQELIELIADSDKGAMRVLFSRHQVRVFRFVMRMVGHQQTAEDMVSEVFLEIWRTAGRFEARSQVTTWMLAIARHKALAALRRHSPGANDEELLQFVEDPTDNPEVAMHKSERSALLRDCIKQLSPAHREVVDLIYYHERSIDDAARIVGVPVNTVKTRVFYARKRIAELMAARGVERASI
jgi:RNA polymerase sigma-70 factor, ECF subfamily